MIAALFWLAGGGCRGGMTNMDASRPTADARRSEMTVVTRATTTPDAESEIPAPAPRPGPYARKLRDLGLPPVPGKLGWLLYADGTGFQMAVPEDWVTTGESFMPPASFRNSVSVEFIPWLPEKYSMYRGPFRSGFRGWVASHCPQGVEQWLTVAGLPAAVENPPRGGPLGGISTLIAERGGEEGGCVQVFLLQFDGKDPEQRKWKRIYLEMRKSLRLGESESWCNPRYDR